MIQNICGSADMDLMVKEKQHWPYSLVNRSEWTDAQEARVQFPELNCCVALLRSLHFSMALLQLLPFVYWIFLDSKAQIPQIINMSNS